MPSLGLERLEELCLPSFLSPVQYAAGSSSHSIVSGDFTGDGRRDLAVADSPSSLIRVLPGNADGTFQSAKESDAGAVLASLAVGDFDGDTKLDLVGVEGTKVRVLLGNGDGTFQAPAVIDIGMNTMSVAVGDFNADGKLDLGVSSNYYVPGSWGWYGWYPGWYQTQATVLLGTGNAAFSAPTTQYVATSYGSTAAAKDLNNDGKSDLVVNAQDGYTTVFLGTATGVAYSSSTYSPYSRAMTLGDVNGDNKIDMVASYSYGNSVSTLLGNGLGGLTYDYNMITSTGANLVDLELADYNGDGKLDVAGTDTDGNVEVLLGTGTGTFKPPIIVTGLGAGSAPTGAAAFDFNGDARADLATSNSGAGNVSVYLNDNVWPALTAPSLTVNDVTVTEGNLGTTTATFTVTLSAASTQPVTVKYATQNGSAKVEDNDYVQASGTLIFAPGVRTQSVPVTVNGDRVIEQWGESFMLVLSDSTDAFIGDIRGVATITDDEPLVSIDYGPTYVPEGNTGSGTTYFTVRLQNPYDAPVRVNYSTFEGDTDFPMWGWYGYYPAPPAATADSDFQSDSGTITFAPGETEKQIPIAVHGDVLAEYDEYFSFNLTDSPDATITTRHAVGVIADDEPRASIGSASATEGHFGMRALQFTVSLSTAPTVPVTVNYTTMDGSASVANSDYKAVAGTVNFAPGDTSETITVFAHGDRTGEWDEYFYVNLTSAEGAMLGSTYGYGTILDDEARISVNDVSMKEGNKGTKNMVFTVQLAAAYDQTVTVKYSTQDWSATAGSDYVAKSGTLTFLPGETSKTVSVAIKGDTKKEYDEVFMLVLEDASPNSYIENYSGGGYILNDDGRPRW